MATDPWAAVPWRVRQLFVSSTFKDLHAERDHLRNFVFPELEDRLRQRRHHLETIDLRLGIETTHIVSEEEKELHVLNVCLDEIARARPYFIAILGDRYGWVPPQDRIAAAATEAGLSIDPDGTSVTVLEIEFAIRAARSDPRQRCWFYFRDPLPYEQMPDGVACEYSDAYSACDATRAGYGRLQELKHRLENDPVLRTRVRRYRSQWEGGHVAGLKAWGQQVLDDLWADLDTDTRDAAVDAADRWEVQEREILDDFIEQRARMFHGRLDITNALLEFSLDPRRNPEQWGICVVGESGSGKSALFAHLQRRLASAGDVVVLAHAAGISPRASQHDDMLRRWNEQLARDLGVDAEQPAAGIEQNFGSLLCRTAAQRRVIVLIDALDQFGSVGRARQWAWLPEPWPENVRLIATAKPGADARALSQRKGIRTEPLAPLDPSASREIAAAIGHRYHRVLPPQVIDTILSKPSPNGLAAGNPLWLTLAIEELHLIGADDFARAERQYHGSPEERLRRMLADVAREIPHDTESLYGWMLRRSEQVFGAAEARAFATAIGVSRFGWREADMRKLVPAVARLLEPERSVEELDDLTFASLRRGFRAHLSKRGPAQQWDFFHAEMRRAVAARNLSGDALTTRIHSAIADYLLSLPRQDSLRRSELMVHLIEADERERAARVYADAHVDDTGSFTNALSRHLLGGGPPALKWVISLLEPQLPAEERNLRPHTLYGARRTTVIASRFQFALNDALASGAPLATRMALLRSVQSAMTRLAGIDATHPDFQRTLAVGFEKIGDVLRDEGNVAGALVAFRQATEIFERFADRYPDEREWQFGLARTARNLARALEGQGDLENSIAANRRSVAMYQRLLSADPGNDRIQLEIARLQLRIADGLETRGDSAGALDAFRAAQAICRTNLASRPGNTPWLREMELTHNGIGDLLLDRDDHTGALEEYRAALALTEQMLEADPGNRARRLAVAHSQIRIAKAQRDDDALLAANRLALAQAEQLAGDDPTSTWNYRVNTCHDSIGMLLAERGDLDGALAAYRACLALNERFVAQDPSNIVRQRNLSLSHGRAGAILARQGDLKGALESCRTGLLIVQECVALDPTNAESQTLMAQHHERIGNLLQRAGDDAGALAALDAAVPIRQRLVDADPTNASVLDSLGSLHGKLGAIYKRRKDKSRTFAHFRSAVKARERVLEIDREDLTAMVSLSLAYEELGDELAREGDLFGALAIHRAALALDERAAALEPTAVTWQNNVAVGHEKIGRSLERSGDVAGAVAEYRAGIAARRHATELGSDAAESWKTLAKRHTSLGDCLRQHNDAAAALAEYRTGMAILERLPEADVERASCANDTGLALEAMRDFSSALENFRSAIALGKEVVAGDPESLLHRANLAVFHGNAGDALMAMNDPAAALEHYRESLSMRQRLLAKEPDDKTRLQHLSGVQNDVGLALEALGDCSAALAAFRTVIVIQRRRLELERNNEAVMQDLAAFHNNAGLQLEKLGDHTAAVEEYRAAADLRAVLAARHPNDRDLQHKLLAARSKISALIDPRTDAKRALADYRTSMLVREQILDRDPEDADTRQNLSIDHDRVGDLFRQRGELSEAMRAYRSSLVLREELARERRDVPVHRWNLSVSHMKIADVLIAEGATAAALKSLAEARKLRQELVAENPDDAEMQRNLALCFDQIGDVLMMAQDLTAALNAFRASMAIRHGLVARDPGNALWQQNLSVSLEKTGLALVETKRRGEAREHFEACLEIRARLAALAPDDDTSQRNLGLAHEKVGNMLLMERSVRAALEHYRVYAGISERLASQYSDNPQIQRDHWLSCFKVAGAVDQLKYDGITGALAPLKRLMVGGNWTSESLEWWDRGFRILDGQLSQGTKLSPRDESMVRLMRTGYELLAKRAREQS